MSIVAWRGKFEKKYYRKRASTAFACNSLVSEHSDDDTITPSTSVTAASVGVCVKTVASTDSDYASNTRIPVMIPCDRSAELLCDTGSDIAVTDEGELHDLTDAVTVDPTASSVDLLKLKQFVSARQGIYTLNKPSLV